MQGCIVLAVAMMLGAHVCILVAAPAGLSPEPARPGSELSARINAVLAQLRGRKELWQVGGRAGGWVGGWVRPAASMHWPGCFFKNFMHCAHRVAVPPCIQSATAPWLLSCACLNCRRRARPRCAAAGVLDDPAGDPPGGSPHAIPGGGPPDSGRQPGVPRLHAAAAEAAHGKVDAATAAAAAAKGWRRRWRRRAFSVHAAASLGLCVLRVAPLSWLF